MHVSAALQPAYFLHPFFFPDFAHIHFEKRMAEIVLIVVAINPGKTIAAGFLLPYWLLYITMVRGIN